jgi:hypothetical protein
LDEDTVAWANIDRYAVNCEGRDAFEPVDALVPIAVIMGHRHVRAGLATHLEHVEAAAGFVLALQEAKGDGPAANDLWHHKDPFFLASARPPVASAQ